ncbi:MAG: helix-turn-helix domain-containing protein [Candidatus Binatus sp.]|uniref:helix-turn-helix domain-containing protein n=1 Tax=Candidatus Binatus sp. TaxID=2811406 RepID=UPI002719927B|nr:helix-turn-helix domain-containing protein [Candidatus Binatus sp.]MDO8431530.1 helix-turn-helix domain-containing protein [Candidatus Binatus sp.]
MPKGKRGTAEPKADTATASSQPSSVAEATLTIPELAEYLRVHPTTIYRLLRAGRIPGFRTGNLWRFDRAVIDRWAEQQTASSHSEGSPPPRRKGRKARTSERT